MISDGHRLNDLPVIIARPGFDVAFKNLTQVTVVAHPSLLKVPEDLEVSSLELWPTSEIPVLNF